MKEIDELLEHAGVKGMKWGVVRWRKPGGKSGKTRNRKPGRVKQEFMSRKREVQWRKTLKQIDTMTTKDMKKVTTRLSLENELKRLSNKKISKDGVASYLLTRKDRENYRLRGNMSDQELTRKVTRLRTKNGLVRNVNEATKEQVDFGKRVAQTAASVGTQYAVKKGDMSIGDLYNSIRNPKASEGAAIDMITKKVTGRNKLK